MTQHMFNTGRTGAHSIRPASWYMWLALAFACVMTAPALAQSDNDLRRENQELAARLEDLEKELEASRNANTQLQERIDELQRQVEALTRGAARRGAPGRAPATASQPEESTSIDESVPHASPRALFKAIVASHDKAMADTDQGREGDGKRRAYLKKLEGWLQQANREFRAPVSWHARVIDARTEDIDGDRKVEFIVTVQAIDPKTEVALGDQFDVRVSSTIAERLDRLQERGDLPTMVLRGIVSPEIRVNVDRGERGSFDNPPFIGTFAEYFWRVDVRSLMPATEDARLNPPPATQPAR